MRGGRGMRRAVRCLGLAAILLLCHAAATALALGGLWPMADLWPWPWGTSRAFCAVPTLPYPPPALGAGDTPELRVFVADWEGFGRFYSQEALRGMERHMDQCEGRRPFRAVYVHQPGEQHTAHAVLYNGPTALVGGRRLATFSRNQKVVAIWHERHAALHFPHPDVDVEVSIRLKAEVPLPYGCFAVHLANSTKYGLWKKPDPRLRRKGVAAVISNCGQGFERRTALLKSLMRHIRVDSYGRCEHNAEFEGLANQVKGWEKQKIAMLTQYRALLAWENTQDENYVSEKVFQALMAGVVPVYWGAPDVEDFVPRGMILNANAYTPETMHQLARELERLQNDDAFFLSFFPERVPLHLPDAYVAACTRNVSWHCAHFDFLWRHQHVPAKHSQQCS
eukprot:GGOE01036968.1.p1 GENE.GGOE01036968.1~~GGOE01036968.1.p1  ORF type:complete len:394 (+),score=94.58 GGOE01036968.1:19-1200(+)